MTEKSFIRGIKAYCLAMEKNFCKRANKPSRTQQEAEAKAAQTGKRAYKCEFCGTWHLTSKPKKARLVFREREEIDID